MTLASTFTPPTLLQLPNFALHVAAKTLSLDKELLYCAQELDQYEVEQNGDFLYQAQEESFKPRSASNDFNPERAFLV
eukprot:2210018-Amphidinium_carterae.2